MFYEEETSPCQVEEDDQTNILQGRLRLQLPGLFNFVAMMTNSLRHAFGMAHLSELTHCLARIYTPSFEQGKQIRATLARRPLCGTGVARQETGVFPDRKTCDTHTKKRNKKRGRKNIKFVQSGL